MEITEHTEGNMFPYGCKSQDIRLGVTRYAEEKVFPPVMRYKRCGRKIFSPYYIRGRKRKKGMGG